MEALIILIPMSILIGCVFMSLFILAHKNGQFDDLETPAVTMLFDEEKMNNSNINDGELNERIVKR